MPKVYLSMEEKEISEKSKKIKRKLSDIKYATTYEEIQKKTGLSKPTIGKIVNNPLKATVEQLLKVSRAAGIELDIVEVSVCR